MTHSDFYDIDEQAMADADFEARDLAAEDAYWDERAARFEADMAVSQPGYLAFDQPADADVTTCSCGCGTVVMVGGKAQGTIEDRYIYEFDGTLDYIELYVTGHADAFRAVA